MGKRFGEFGSRSGPGEAVSAATKSRMNSRGPAALLALAGALALVFVPTAGGQQPSEPAADAATAKAASSDPLLQAMEAELQRSKAHLKMENVQAPYYIDYRLTDVDEYNMEAAFGALRSNTHVHSRYVRVVVRVGDYKLDSYIGPGVGVVNYAPVDNDPEALRWQIWAATDQAYKIASQTLAAKRAMLSQFATGQQFDDFAHEPAVQMIEPLSSIQFDPKPWQETLEKASGLFRSDPKIEMLSSVARCWAVNQYFVNTEGTFTRHGYTGCFADTTGTTQAADGMHLEDDAAYRSGTPDGLPSRQRVLDDTGKMLERLKALREAPIAEEDYQGPVLFSPAAASEVLDALIGSNVLGQRPRPGDSARTVGPFASSYKTRVLPPFVSIIDDPTMTAFHGETLQGHYTIDDEGVPPAKVPVIENGILVNYLIGREPIQDFPHSNGHGRAGPGQPPRPNVGVLEIESNAPVALADLKAKLIDLCRQDNLPYGYYLKETAGVRNTEPRLLYRVYVSDGHEELVRGAVFSEFDPRSLRNGLVALGNDPVVSNREGTVPRTIISPSMLVDDLEVKHSDQKNARLPEYSPPDLGKSQ